MYNVRDLDHLSVGIMQPNGEYARPMSGNSLFWTKPGEGFIS